MLPLHQLPSPKIMEEIKTSRKAPPTPKVYIKRLKSVLNRILNIVKINDNKWFSL